MINKRTGEDIKYISPLDDEQIYLYVIQNSVGKVKVGISTNPYKRYMSLCGSNSQGNTILQMYVSQPTYLKSLEEIMHNRMKEFRIPNTEWFYYPGDETGNTLFSSAVKLLEKYMRSKEYETCNSVRENLSKRRQNND